MYLSHIRRFEISLLQEQHHSHKQQSQSSEMFLFPFGTGSVLTSTLSQSNLREGSSCIFSANHIPVPTKRSLIKECGCGPFPQSSDKGSIVRKEQHPADKAALKGAALIKLGCSAHKSSVHTLGYGC